MISLYWVATYGNTGLEVEHFTSERQYRAAARRAEREHRAGYLDSYTHGEQPVKILPSIR